jgi:hypothetical protein
VLATYTFEAPLKKKKKKKENERIRKRRIGKKEQRWEGEKRDIEREKSERESLLTLVSRRV